MSFWEELFLECELVPEVEVFEGEGWRSTRALDLFFVEGGEVPFPLEVEEEVLGFFKAMRVYDPILSTF
jgi:hypothetical protein